jgi:hypothetical protein
VDANADATLGVVESPANEVAGVRDELNSRAIGNGSSNWSNGIWENPRMPCVKQLALTWKKGHQRR